MIPDRPSLPELLRTVRGFLDGIAPGLASASDRYEARVASYLLEMAEREIGADPAIGERHRRALGALLGTDDPLPELRRTLAGRLRAGELDERLDEVARLVLDQVTDQARIVRPSHLDPISAEVP